MRIFLLLLGLVGTGAALGVRSHRHESPKIMPIRDGETELVVPHVKGSISLDGDLDDSGWLGPIAHTGAFVDKNGAGAKPYSEARATWGDGVLYLSFYAADEDIRATVKNDDGEVWRDDSFHFVFDDGKDERIFDASVNAIIRDGSRPSIVFSKTTARPPIDFSWSSGAFISRELDGTPNDASDDDEEWTLEIAIPLEAIGLRGEVGERVRFAAHRCDLMKNGQRVCASFGEKTPAVLVLQ